MFEVFEDNGETGYMYLCNWNCTNGLGKISDHLWIYNHISPRIQDCKDVFITWTDDSQRAGLVVDGECWGILDLKNRRKMNAPRIENAIVTVERKYWDMGLAKDDGEPLQIEKNR